MNFKQLLITTMACSAMTQFAMADIVLKDVNDKTITVKDSGEIKVGVDFKYGKVKNITVSGIVGNNEEELAALNCIFRTDVVGDQGVNLTFENVAGGKFLDRVLGYLFEVGGGVSEVHVSSLEKGKSGKKVVDTLCNVLEEKNGASIKGAKLELEGRLGENENDVYDVGRVLGFGISELTVRNVGKVYASKYGAVEKINIDGNNTLWSDLWHHLKLANDQEGAGKCFADHHGGFITAIKIPSSLKELNYNAKPKDGKGNFVTGKYIGYSGLALFTEKANKNLKLTLNEYTSSVYFVLDNESWRNQVLDRKPIYEVVKFMTEKRIGFLGKLKVADNCYQTLKDIWSSIFIVDEKNVKTILAPKEEVDTAAVKQIDSNGIVSEKAVNGKSMSLEDRTEIIKKFNDAK